MMSWIHRDPMVAYLVCIMFLAATISAIGICASAIVGHQQRQCRAACTRPVAECVEICR